MLDKLRESVAVADLRRIAPGPGDLLVEDLDPLGDVFPPVPDLIVRWPGDRDLHDAHAAQVIAAPERAGAHAAIGRREELPPADRLEPGDPAQGGVGQRSSQRLKWRIRTADIQMAGVSRQHAARDVGPHAD